MDRETIRLECLKLRHRFDLHPEAIIVDASILERYVAEGIPEKKEAAKEKAAKKETGNLEMLS